MNNRKKLCFIVNLNRSDSFPAKPTAAQAIAIDCGEIILPVTPPEAFAASAKMGSIATFLAVSNCNGPNKLLAAVSEPVMNTPSQPRTGDKKQNIDPVVANVAANANIIPE